MFFLAAKSTFLEEKQSSRDIKNNILKFLYSFSSFLVQSQKKVVFNTFFQQLFAEKVLLASKKDIKMFPKYPKVNSLNV